MRPHIRRIVLVATLGILLATLLVPVFGASAQASGQTFYIVAPGDTLARIAARFGTTAQVIAQLNGVYNLNLIYPGQRLLIPNVYVPPVPVPPVPVPPAPTPPPAAGSYYAIRYGDTLRNIAAWYGTTWQALAYANNIARPNLIYAGMVLYIPPAPVYTRVAAYQVVYGDTLARIAARFGSSVSAIVSYNLLPNPNTIYAGQLLSVPY